jgi:hypothetical protein
MSNILRSAARMGFSTVPGRLLANEMEAEPPLDP